MGVIRDWGGHVKRVHSIDGFCGLDLLDAGSNKSSTHDRRA